MTSHTRKLVDGGYATTRQAAEHLGCSMRTIQRLIQGRILSHAQHGGRLVIPWISIKEYAAQRLQLGSVA